MARDEELSSLTQGLFYNGEGLKILTPEQVVARESKLKAYHERRGSVYEPSSAYIAFRKMQNQKGRIKERKERRRPKNQAQHSRKKPGPRNRAQHSLKFPPEDC